MSVEDEDARWFPGTNGASQVFEYCWQLAEGRLWRAEDFEGGVDLTGLRFVPPNTLELDFLVNDGEQHRFEFRGVVDLQIDGAFSLGPSGDGWEVFDTVMIAADHPRADGRWVYVLDLHTGMLCFASLPGARVN